jgi:hypothetical protein
MKLFNIIMVLSAFSISAPVLASPASDALMAEFKAAGATHPDAAKGKAAWAQENRGEDGEMTSCSSCHTTNLSQAGKHHKTRKTIEPMSQRVNAERFTDKKKMEKWFKRNCKDVLARECTVQEKADFLAFLLAQ